MKRTAHQYERATLNWWEGCGKWLIVIPFAAQRRSQFTSGANVLICRARFEIWQRRNVSDRVQPQNPGLTVQIESGKPDLG